MRIKYFLFSFLVIFFSACSSENEKAESFEVIYHGALKNFMMKGDISAKADLSELKDIDHLYALGALEKLKGEILILDSEPYMTSADGEAVAIDPSFDHKASLLVYAVVNEWQTFDIPEALQTYEELEQYIAETAAAHGIDVNQPFPFLLEGSFATIKWHSIDWEEGDMEHSHEKHMTSGPNGILNNRQADMLGFYSNSHHAVFTHHTTNMHLHLKTKDGKIVGHVDGLTLGENIVLKLPVI
jgi:acetolactate decarboxylase